LQLKKYKFSSKKINNQDYLYIQHATYIDKKQKTESYCIGKMSKFNELMNKIMSTSESLFFGEMILFKLFEKLNINRVISKDFKTLGLELYDIKILQSMISSRILHSFSKLKLNRYLKNSLMKFTHKIDHVNDIYHAMELTKDHESYFRKYVALVFKKMKYRYDTNYFDTTNIYFYSDIDDFRTYAYSKDGKRGLPHISLALACTEDRIPLYYDISPGKTADITCFKKYMKTKPVNNKIFIFDAGCYSFDVITQLESDEFKSKYICGADISKYEYTSDLNTIELHEQKWDVREAKYNNHRVIEAYNIEHHEQKIEKLDKQIYRIKKLAQTVKGKTIDSKRDKVYDLISSLGLKSQIKVNIVKNKLELIIVDEKIKKLKDKAKKIILITNLKSKSSEILEKYLGRIEVEKAFQYLKNPLSIRPIYHGKEINIRAHGFIVMMGYLQLTIMRHYLSKNYNINITLDELLEELQFATCVAIEPKNGKFLTYAGRQLKWIKQLISDLDLPIIINTSLHQI